VYPAFGGGVWMELAELHHVLTATLASSGEPARFYLKTSFHF